MAVGAKAGAGCVRRCRSGFSVSGARKQATDIMDSEDLEQELWVFYLEQLELNATPVFA